MCTFRKGKYRGKFDKKCNMGDWNQSRIAGTVLERYIITDVNAGIIEWLGKVSIMTNIEKLKQYWTENWIAVRLKTRWITDVGSDFRRNELEIGDILE